MSDQTSQSGQPPAPSVTPAAPAASSSTVQLDQQPLRTPLDLRRAIEQMKANTPKPGSQPSPAVPAPVAESPAVEATPAEAATEAPQEETPEVVGDTEPAETPAEDTTQEPEEDDGGEGPVNPLTGKRAHLRLNESDEVGRLALAFQKRNRDWDLLSCVEAAKKQLGINAPAEAQASVAAEDPKIAALPKTVAEVDTATSQLLADYKKAMQEVRFEDAADMQEKLMNLTRHRSSLERSAEKQEQAHVTKYHADFSKSESQAIDLYPFAADPASAGAKRMAQIEATMLKNGDPAYNSANKPLLLAQMVAAELKIAPRNKNATPAKAAAPAVPAPKKGVVPSGSSRTTPPAQNQPAVDPAISGIKNMTDLRVQLRRLGVK